MTTLIWAGIAALLAACFVLLLDMRRMRHRIAAKRREQTALAAQLAAAQQHPPADPLPDDLRVGAHTLRVIARRRPRSS